jgi:hypothetical protein
MHISVGVNFFKFFIYIKLIFNKFNNYLIIKCVNVELI